VAEKKLGKIHVYTGNGKGKTTASFGLAIRAAGRGLSVLIIQFLKGKTESGEVISVRRLGIKVEQYGTGSFLWQEELSKEDRLEAEKAFARAEKALMNREADLIILDEINVAVTLNIVSIDDLLRIIDSKPKDVELVLTGRGAKQELIARADYVTEMLLQKHPYEKGSGARIGIEY